MVVASTIRDKDSKDHPTRVNSPTRSLIMGSSMLAKITQINREAHKDNPIRDNLWPLVVRLLHILGNLLETRDNPMPNKVNQVPSKATLRGNLMGSRDNLMGSKVNL